jgi:FlaA1/EpsC-like NDP-sugar epimerase
MDKEMVQSFFSKRTKSRRTLFFVTGDGILLSLALYLSFFLKFDGNITPAYLNNFFTYLSIFLLVKYSVFTIFRLYRMNWSMVGFYELFDIWKANTISLLLLLGIFFLFSYHSMFGGFPRSIPLIDYGVSLVLITMFRTSRRVYLQARLNRNHADAKRTLIIGAGDAGEQIVRAMRRQDNSPYMPVGFIDDNVMKHGDYIQGIKVLGSQKDIPAIVDTLRVETVLISIPSSSSRDIRQILAHVRNSSAKEIKTIPGLHSLVSQKISLSDIQEIRIEDIIGREQITVDERKVGNFIRGKCLLITGAGGSIGSELVRQALTFNPEKIIALDADESELYQLEKDLRQSGHINVIPVVADIRNRDKIQDVLNGYVPDVVFHAAAYKHVPMMEQYPEEAVCVNILGTKNVAEAALSSGTEKFILVSTDKAVRPANIMGATKHVAEKIVNALNALGSTSFSSVRFGNVVGSRGSVFTIFERQLRSGGPITVTHREMKRYFMSIPEACMLIFQAAAIGRGGEMFHLDMGEQIKIVDIARELAHLNGLKPDIDIPIVFTGVRPGEKLHEELLTDSEHAEPTEHPKIFRVRDIPDNENHVLQRVLLFEQIIRRKQWAWIRNLLYELVPSYNPSFQEEVHDDGARSGSGQLTGRNAG